MSKMRKHLDDLANSTSGGSHDAVMFSGKGLELLKSIPGLKDLFKSSRTDDDDEEDDDEEEFQKSGDNTRYPQSRRNGGDLEDEEEDPEDPADTNEEENEADGDRGSIISNHGKRTKKSSLKQAVSKNAYQHDEKRFEKNFDEHEEVLDASPALRQLIDTVNIMGKRFAKSQNGLAETVQIVAQQNVVLGKVVGELLKSNAALAGEIELIKKTPVTQPASGILTLEMKKNDKTRSLRKSDVEDAINDAMGAGLADPSLLSSLAYVRTQADLREFVDDLPEEIRERI